MKAPRLALSLSAVVLLALPAAAQVGGRIVARSDGQPRLSGLKVRPQVVHQLRLKAAADSAVEFESFVVEVLDDGTRRVRGTVRVDDREDHSRFRWVADVNAGTYRVERIPLTAEQIEAMRPSRRFDDAETQDIEDPPNNCEDPSPEMCTDHCNGSWTATVTNEDPATFDLSRTTVSGSWGIYGAQTCRWRETYSGSCWANPLTPINTTWYVDSCVRYGPTVIGDFHNDDWGWDHIPTYARSSVAIRRVDGLGTFIDWYSSFSGESASLLYGTMDQSGSNTCF